MSSILDIEDNIMDETSVYKRIFEKHLNEVIKNSDSKYLFNPDYSVEFISHRVTINTDGGVNFNDIIFIGNKARLMTDASNFIIKYEYPEPLYLNSIGMLNIFIPDYSNEILDVVNKPKRISGGLLLTIKDLYKFSIKNPFFNINKNICPDISRIKLSVNWDTSYRMNEYMFEYIKNMFINIIPKEIIVDITDESNMLGLINIRGLTCDNLTFNIIYDNIESYLDDKDDLEFKVLNYIFEQNNIGNLIFNYYKKEGISSGTCFKRKLYKKENNHILSVDHGNIYYIYKNII